jgi:hypothetical protein
MDAVALGDQFVEDLAHNSGSGSSARITGVLVQQAVRYKNNAATAFVT